MEKPHCMRLQIGLLRNPQVTDSSISNEFSLFMIIGSNLFRVNASFRLKIYKFSGIISKVQSFSFNSCSRHFKKFKTTAIYRTIVSRLLNE